ncbi:nitroreductase [Spongiibacter sp. KMU-158]|uniref:Nitroreductase n=1 Tax=Spongiibacter pelagi TaxID=2760804 RepID=A0A927GV86_9GAMM|nr:nitroreductase [Spongiibacter pelagi]MBD2858406.1 nitroreductase [Spongiibacter pelagi]
MDKAAVFAEIIKQRRSVRAFQANPVPEHTLKTVFELAQRAPSNCNTQPWQVALVSGATLEGLRAELPKVWQAGGMTMDFPYDGSYEGVYKTRQYDAARTLYDAMGIERSDKPARQEQFMRNFTFFGAPHCAFLFLPEPFGLREAADLGMYAQNLMLSMAAHGIASVPQTALGFFANTLREALDIPESQKLMFGISFGFEDGAAPENKALTDRAIFEDVVKQYN